LVLISSSDEKSANSANATVAIFSTAHRGPLLLFFFDYTSFPLFLQYLAEEARKKQELENCRLADFQIKTTLGTLLLFFSRERAAGYENS
jgi:hypothetical protein